MTDEIPQWTSIIGGVPRSGGPAYEIRDPGQPDRVVARAVDGDTETVDAAVEAAREAAETWSALPGPVRGDHLARFLDAVEQDAEAIARQMTLEQGKIIAESRGEVAKGVGEGRYMLAEAYRQGVVQRPSTRVGGWNMARRMPHGVVAAINPWNFPFSTPLRKIMPALVAGNTIVLKPSELTPGPLCLLAQAATRSGLPEGSINVVLGSGRLVGQAMVEHPGVDMVTFTGSTNTGRAIAVAAARRLIPVQLEMGGKNAGIVTKSADLDLAAQEITRAALVCSGQRCTAISRVLVDQHVVAELTSRLRAAFSAVRPGHGLEADSNIGPLVSAEHLENVDGMVSRAHDRGARIITGGAPLNGPGYFYPATLIEAKENCLEILTEEVFGPVLTITPFRTLDEAITLHENTIYGLTGAVFGRNPEELASLRDRMKTGMLHMNAGTFPENNMPFAGAKHSSAGAPSVGEQALDAFTRWQAVYT